LSENYEGHKLDSKQQNGSNNSYEIC